MVRSDWCGGERWRPGQFQNFDSKSGYSTRPFSSVIDRSRKQCWVARLRLCYGATGEWLEKAKQREYAIARPRFAQAAQYGNGRDDRNTNQCGGERKAVRGSVATMPDAL